MTHFTALTLMLANTDPPIHVKFDLTNGVEHNTIFIFPTDEYLSSFLTISFAVEQIPSAIPNVIISSMPIYKVPAMQAPPPVKITQLARAFRKCGSHLTRDAKRSPAQPPIASQISINI